jgi:hypothetical protein
MVGVLGLLTGWVLLMPLLTMLFVMSGGPYQTWMGVFLGIAASFPLLVFMTLAGLAMIALSVRRLARPQD